jgi:hypothetical protein
MSNRQYRALVSGGATFRISRQGIDAVSPPSAQDLLFDSAWPGAWPIYWQGLVNLTNSSTSNGVTTYFNWGFYNDLGYVPFVDCYLIANNNGATLHSYYPYATQDAYMCNAFRDRVWCASVVNSPFKVTIYRRKAFDVA